MLYIPTIISIAEVLILTLPVLFVVALVTIAERKTVASMQRRLGPNLVGYYGLLQAFADAFKLLLKKYVSPTQANFLLFFLASIITLKKHGFEIGLVKLKYLLQKVKIKNYKRLHTLYVILYLELFSLDYLYKLIKTNLIFRSFLFINYILLIYLGINNFTASYIVTSFVIFLIVYSLIKAKSKSIFIVVLFRNLFILFIFWSFIYYISDTEILSSFLSFYILSSFDDFDFSDVLASYGLSNKCIGDPVTPGGNGNGEPDLNILINRDDNTYELGSDNSFKWPGLQNYKKFIVYENKQYITSDIQKSIKNYNEKLVYPRVDELVFERNFLYSMHSSSCHLNNYIKYPFYMQTVSGYINEVNYYLSYFTLEYNTLEKAKFFYENKDILSNDTEYSKAFEIWQKRQIAIANLHYLPDIDTREPVYEIIDYTLDKNAYEETCENLFFVKLKLIQMKIISDYIKKNSHNLDHSDINNFFERILPIIESHIKEYEEAYNALRNYHLKILYSYPKSAILDFFKHRCTDYFKENINVNFLIIDKYFLEQKSTHLPDKGVNLQFNVGLNLVNKFNKFNFKHIEKLYNKKI